MFTYNLFQRSKLLTYFARSNKMLKINKSVHFTILTVFAIVFVCVYLYYTINDVKKIAVEVKKHGQDIANIVTSLGAITKELTEIKKQKVTCTIPQPSVPEVQATEVQTSAPVEDNESVQTDDVKNLLSDIPDDDDDKVAVDNDISVELGEVAPKDIKTLTLEDLKAETYEDLKKYCKDNGLSTKGTKDAIIQRILSA